VDARHKAGHDADGFFRMRWILIVVAALAVTIAAALAGMLAFGTSAPPEELTSLAAPFRNVDFGDLPSVQTLKVSQRSPIAYRAWLPNAAPSDPALVVIAIHGSSAQSASMHPLGKALSAEGIPVYAPDIRGHGDTGTRGDIDYAGELDDDMADFTAMVRGKYPSAKLVLIGFSSGGGYALHVAATPLGKNFARAVLLSPMLGPFAPTTRPAQKYAKPFIPRILALAVLDRIGIHALDHLTTLLLAIDPARTDILVGHYSWLLMRAFATSDYAADLRAAQTPLAVVAGENDELFFADKFAPSIDAVRPGVPVSIVPGLSHTGLTVDARGVPAILAAIRGPS
jgi:alpha-beta hydrolase superfamily lysophospholipase